MKMSPSSSSGRDRDTVASLATNRFLRLVVVVTVFVIMMFTVTSFHHRQDSALSVALSNKDNLLLMFCSAFQPHGQTQNHRRRIIPAQAVLRHQQQRTNLKPLWASLVVDEEAAESIVSPPQPPPTYSHDELIIGQQAHTMITPGEDTTSITSRSSSVAAAAADDDDDDAVPTKMSDAIQRFFLGGDKGPLIVVGIVVAMTYWRFLGPTMTSMTATATTTTNFDSTWKDGVVMVSAVVFWLFQEHFLHQKVLHSDVDWIGKQIHEEHHEKPYYHVSIDSAPSLLTWMTIAHMVLFRWWLSLPLALSATIGYALAGLTYEWSHYIVHTRVKLTNKFWIRVRDNHIRHHRLSHEHWFSFTMPWLDDLFGTNPPIQQVQQARRRKQQRKPAQRQRQAATLPLAENQKIN
mmetsp:Transcript_38079/g.92635  ORF Transcript_38079/g.92635 Transcript_38079/m.92635 type:complete len:406 (-) Transcript_38079:118-1335(-)